MAAYIEAPDGPFRKKRFYLHVGAPVVAISGHDGMTVGNHIYCRSKCPSEHLIAHEYAHVLQWDRIGWWKFPLVYAWKRRHLEADAEEFARLYHAHFAAIAAAACQDSAPSFASIGTNKSK